MLGIFDGHNDSVQRLKEYRPDGIDFLARSTDGHLDLPRAMDGGLAWQSDQISMVRRSRRRSKMRAARRI